MQLRGQNQCRQQPNLFDEAEKDGPPDLARRSFVFDLDKEEASGWCGVASGAAVAGGEDFWDVVDGNVACCGLDEGAYQVADHVVQEA